MHIDYVLTSAKQNIGVEEAFTKLIEKCYDRLYGYGYEQMMRETTSPNGGWLSGWSFWNRDKDETISVSDEYTEEKVEVEMGNAAVGPENPVHVSPVQETGSSGCCGSKQKNEFE